MSNNYWDDEDDELDTDQNLGGDDLVKKYAADILSGNVSSFHEIAAIHRGQVATEPSHARRARDRPFLTWWLYSRVPGDGCRSSPALSLAA